MDGPLADPGDAGQPDLTAHEPKWASFLDQGRWLLEEQQRRGASFQTTAGTLLGFDGVVLGILASNDFLAADGSWSFRAVVGKVGVLALAASAYAAVRVIAPRAAGSVVIDDTLDAWKDFHDDNEHAKVRPTQHFAHMLLAKEPAPATTELSRRRWWKRREGRRQVLYQAADLAEHRSKWTQRSAWSLMGAVVALVLAVFAAPGTPSSSSTTPTPSPTSTTHQ